MPTDKGLAVERIERVDVWEFVLGGTVPLVLCAVSKAYPTDDETLVRIGIALQEMIYSQRKRVA